jgi:hypothetical protein
MRLARQCLLAKRSIARLGDVQVFTRVELEGIAELCIKHDLIALCDEVRHS